MSEAGNSEEQLQNAADETEIEIIRRTLSERWSQILSAFMLAAVAVGTAWSGYQAARWGGFQSLRFSEASSRRVESTRSSTLAGQMATVDVMLFSGFVNAFAEGNEELAQFYEDRFREEFVPAYEAWIATDPRNNPDAPPEPFSMPEYKLSEMEKAIALEEEAAQLFEEGKDANQTSDEYVFNSVLLATVLFFAGIATQFEWQPIRWALLGLGSIMLIYGIYTLLTLPIQ
ncbi:MAG: hypothetical protein GTO18_14215 [Anaerolineales bacterium]|nr:hypothetical protein [Anaerolineales bacterium]